MNFFPGFFFLLIFRRQSWGNVCGMCYLRSLCTHPYNAKCLSEIITIWHTEVSIDLKCISTWNKIIIKKTKTLTDDSVQFGIGANIRELTCKLCSFSVHISIFWLHFVIKQKGAQSLMEDKNDEEEELSSEQITVLLTMKASIHDKHIFVCLAEIMNILSPCDLPTWELCVTCIC